MSMSISGFNSQAQLLRLLQASWASQNSSSDTTSTSASTSASASSAASTSDARPRSAFRRRYWPFCRSSAASRPTAARVRPAALRAAARAARAPAARHPARRRQARRPASPAARPRRVRPTARRAPAACCRRGDRSHQSAGVAECVEFVVERFERVNRLQRVVIDRWPAQLRPHGPVEGADSSSPVSSRASTPAFDLVGGVRQRDTWARATSSKGAASSTRAPTRATRPSRRGRGGVRGYAGAATPIRPPLRRRRRRRRADRLIRPGAGLGSFRRRAPGFSQRQRITRSPAALTWRGRICASCALP